MYEQTEGGLRVFLVHPGGPFFKNKDDGYWSIPKGLVEEGEDHLEAALREFKEETGIKPEGEFIPLGEVKQKSGKTVKAWAFKNSMTALPEIKSNTFELEWPPKSGRMNSFPEIDRGEWFGLPQAKKKINKAQAKFIDNLKEYIVERIINSDSNNGELK